jgi:hypothetical protein
MNVVSYVESQCITRSAFNIAHHQFKNEFILLALLSGLACDVPNAGFD